MVIFIIGFCGALFYGSKKIKLLAFIVFLIPIFYTNILVEIFCTIFWIVFSGTMIFYARRKRKESLKVESDRDEDCNVGEFENDFSKVPSGEAKKVPPRMIN